MCGVCCVDVRMRYVWGVLCGCEDEVCVGCAVWMRFVWGVLCG